MIQKSLCGRTCTQCKFKERCEGCSLCEVAVCSKNCSHCSALCLNRPQAAEYVNSKISMDASPKSNTALELPAHIPILPDKFKTTPPFELLPVIGIHAGNMFSSNGERISPLYMQNGYTGALNIDDRTKAILEFYIKDRTLEGFWDKRQKIYPVLKSMDFYAVIAPNFSVYEDAPRIDHLYNIRRSVTVYNELIDAGITAVPDVSWYNLTDLDWWCNEINKNGIKTIAFSFQVVAVGIKSSTVWRSYLLGFRYLCQNIPQDTNIIIAGIVSPFRLKEVYEAADKRRMHILNQSAYVQSRRGMLSETRTQNTEIPFDSLFMQNIQYFNNIYDEILATEDNIFTQILKWDKDRLINFYRSYLNGTITDIEEGKRELAFSIVCRQLRKKKIKVVVSEE